MQDDQENECVTDDGGRDGHEEVPVTNKHYHVMVHLAGNRRPQQPRYQKACRITKNRESNDQRSPPSNDAFIAQGIRQGNRAIRAHACNVEHR